jgi:hypothetical protein
MHCADCDPILYAAPIACGECKAESWPVEAQWAASGTYILAAFESVHEPWCRRRTKYGTVLLDICGDGTLPQVRRPRRCRATASTTGQPCRAYAKPGSGYCHSHDQARSQR